MLVYPLILFVVGICAIQAVRSRQLLYATLWLAAASVLTSALLYTLGAWQLAILELSVGGGLIPLLLLITLNTSETITETLAADRSARTAALGLIAFMTALLILLLNGSVTGMTAPERDLNTVWVLRQQDLLLQALVLFVGLLTVIGWGMKEGRP